MKAHKIFFLIGIGTLLIRGVLLGVSGTHLVNTQSEGVQRFVQEYSQKILDAFEKKDWKHVLYYCKPLMRSASSTAFTQDLYYYQGVAYFELKDYYFAAQSFSQYLKSQRTPKFFEEALHYKFLIAEEYRMGAKMRLFSLKNMPKWEGAHDDALKIYEEIITVLPHKEEAAQALFGKAQIFEGFEEYRSSVEVLQQLIRRFPKHSLAVEGYVEIAKVYLKQSSPKHQDPDLLDLAEINLKKFRQAFPREERIQEVEKLLEEMKEIYAKGLYEVGQFFERTHKVKAAKLYYSKVLAKFPSTQMAKRCHERIKKL